jgi:hypothetical protein
MTLVNGEVPPNAVAVLSHFDTAGALELALALQPDAREAILVSGASVLDRRWVDAARAQLPDYGDRLKIVPRGRADAEAARAARAPAPRHDRHLSGHLARRQRRALPVRGARGTDLRRLERSGVRVLAETYLGGGIVGGRFESWEGIGADIGGAVQHMLAGERQPLRSYTAPPAFAVDWRQLRRWGLDENRLPPGTTVLYREPSAWDQYKSLVFAVAALVAVQALLIAVWLLRLREQRAGRALKLAEAETQQQREQVMHLTRVAILGQLSGALAHELNQPLTAILSNAQAAQRMLARQPLDLGEFHAILSDIVADNTRRRRDLAPARAAAPRRRQQLEPLDIGAVVADVLALTRAARRAADRDSGTQCAAMLPLVLGDRVQLQQVLLNLLLNASEAMSANAPPHDRRLTVSTALSDEGFVVVASPTTVRDRARDGRPSGHSSRSSRPKEKRFWGSGSRSAGRSSPRTAAGSGEQQSRARCDLHAHPAVRGSGDGDARGLARARGLTAERRRLGPPRGLAFTGGLLAAALTAVPGRARVKRRSFG